MERKSRPLPPAHPHYSTPEFLPTTQTLYYPHNTTQTKHTSTPWRAQSQPPSASPTSLQPSTPRCSTARPPTPTPTSHTSHTSRYSQLGSERFRFITQRNALSVVTHPIQRRRHGTICGVQISSSMKRPTGHSSQMCRLLDRFFKAQLHQLLLCDHELMTWAVCHWHQSSPNTEVPAASP